MNDQEFITALEDCSLDKRYFNHRGHLRAAWLYLDRYPVNEAAEHCARSIQRYANHLGATDKFHVTLTRAFMHIIAELRASHPATNWEDFLSQCPDLVEEPRRLIARHYSDDVLDSEKARTEFVAPDLAPLPQQ
ncbi:MAG: hypothetical protein R3270_02555 [Gammaproteobacteria bacterium]|nr:hypothetical protein [Gammaproteobacteria bacterium]